ncbi:MAG TPA: TlpA disulfide reductase family protein, partial [Bryobacteraceae bacterium]
GSPYRGPAMALMLALALTFAPARARAAGLGGAAPEFALRDSRGAAVALSQFRGKVVLLNFWATWCHGCKQEIPWFVEYEKKYKHKGLVVIGVSLDEDGWTSVRPYLKEKKLNYPVVAGDQALAKRYGGIDTMPATFLIDRKGRIAASYSGMVDRDECEEKIRILLRK